MCDLAYVNLLREKARRQEAEEKRVTAFGSMHRKRFVPWIMPAQGSADGADKKVVPDCLGDFVQAAE